MGRTKTGRGIPRVGGRGSLRITAPLSVLALVAAGIAPTADAATVQPASHTPTAVGAVATAPAGATRVGAPSDSTVITVDALLAPRNSAELARYATAVSTPGSPFYKDYLTPRQVADLVAPSDSTVQAVDAALRAAGLAPGTASQDNLTIPVTAPLGKLKSAFGISFAGYRLANGRTAFGATSAPKVDGTVAAALTGIVGLNDFAVPTTNVENKTHNQGVRGAGGVTAAAANSSAAPVMCSSFKTALTAYLGSFGDTPVDGGNYYSPAALSTAYGTASELSHGDNGSHVTVAVLEWEAVSGKALATYQSCFGLHNKISYVNTDGGPKVAPTATNNVGIEASLDIEDIASLAPGSSIIDYQGLDASDASFTDADWLDTIDAAVLQDRADVLSISWGACEQQDDNATRSGETTAFEIAALQGQSVFTSAGDEGSTDCQDASGNALSTIAVDDPSSNPWVTAVGGTYMQGKTSPSIKVWNDSAVQGGAGGGGVSTTYKLSGFGNYQWGFKGKGYSAKSCGASYGSACRQVPDVSAIADWQAGFPQIYFADKSGFDVLIDGGTSLAAPTMAAITALADASRPCRITGAVGFANPAYYDLARNPWTYAHDFSDVTVGNNDYTTSGYTGGNYVSTKGYDLASGLGSPKAAALSASLCGW